MRRIRSIDNIRGLIIVLMIWVHLTDWWLVPGDIWFADFFYIFLDRLLGPSFLFVSGVSALISYRNSVKRIDYPQTASYSKMKNEYFIRAGLIIVVGLMFNLVAAVMLDDPRAIWTWFMLLTIGFSLLIAWPLLKLSILSKVSAAVIIWIINYLVLYMLLPFQGQSNFLGILFQVLYNSLRLEPILSHSSFLILGTAIGDLLYKIYNIEDAQQRRVALKKKILFPLIVLASVTLPLGFLIEYPLFLEGYIFFFLLISVGGISLLLIIFITIEEYSIFEIKRQNGFLFYFSFYSFTIYLSHNALYFLFYRQLNLISIWFFFAGTIFVFFLLFRSIYNSNYRQLISVKTMIGRIARVISNKIPVTKVSLKYPVRKIN